MSAEVADVLDKAADLLERDGWIQGDSEDELGRLCAGRAIQDCAPARVGYYRVVEALRPYLDAAVVEWNDEPGRTAAEVIAKLREAAAVERAS